MDDKELTYGEVLVGIKFNPSGESRIDRIKRLSADLIDELDALRTENLNTRKPSPKVSRSCATAITHVETASMFGVKAIVQDAERQEALING